MNEQDYKNLNGEQIMHCVWIVRDSQPIGICDQTITDIKKMIADGEEIIKIEPRGGTLENKIRQCERWGCE